MALTILLWLGVILLSVGFCGVFGTLLRKAAHGPVHARAQAALFGALLVLPSTAVVLGLPGPAFPARVAFLLVEALVAAAVCARPGWAPDVVWSRSFARAYFSAAMGVTALWELGLALTFASAPSAILAAAASVAGVASFGTSRRPA